MKRFRSAASLALAVVAVLGLAGPAAAGEQVPFKGSLEGDVTVTPLTPPLLHVDVEATGKATHLGKFTLDIPHVVNPATRPAVGILRVHGGQRRQGVRRVHRASHAHRDPRRPLHRGDRNHHGRHGPVRRRHRELHQRATVRHGRPHDHRFLRGDHLHALIENRMRPVGSLPPCKPPTGPAPPWRSVWRVRALVIPPQTHKGDDRAPILVPSAGRAPRKPFACPPFSTRQVTPPMPPIRRWPTRTSTTMADPTSWSR